jgi:2-iminobutanoate/2-iminopropanoate deaminase
MARRSRGEPIRRVYAPYFPDPKPVRTTVGSQLPGILVEIDVVAYLGEK